ncbi:hypothetical protein GDO86_008163 [Hymenochirus boettgeri]|uniref:Uncharacterized protein n=1 Tax=Hymenochirus boettgeri TaxID=247094 RepID=A0A8T2J0V7_9PIPI|nr:hypothetical protein GDO86_008163 [Hymenochirus boettgeri]
MDIIYKPLPPEEAQQLGLQLQDPRKAVSFVNAFLKHSMPNVKKSLQENLERKAVVLEYSYKKKKKKSNKSKVLTAKERREMRIFEIKPEQQKYELFLPLHELWRLYIRDLCNGLRPDANKVQMPILCGPSRNNSSGNKACIQDSHKRRQIENCSKVKLCF